MQVTKENTMHFNTPVGRAHVWGLVNCQTQGVGGWHFALPSTNGLENYYSENGYVFSTAVVHAPNLLIGEQETDEERVNLLRKLWESYIQRLDLYATGYSEPVTIGV
jgi:hypothetical protein